MGGREEAKMYGPGTLFVLAAAYGSLDEAVADYGAVKAS